MSSAGPLGSWPDRPRRLRAPSPGDLPPDVADIMERYGYPARLAPPMFRTLALNPEAFLQWLPFHVALVNGHLDRRMHELLVLRTVARCAATYGWDRHVPRALKAGLSSAQIDALARDPAAWDWSVCDRALIEAVDQLHDGAQISDATWTILADHLNAAQLVEMTMLVGYYHLIAYIANALGVPGSE